MELPSIAVEIIRCIWIRPKSQMVAALGTQMQFLSLYCLSDREGKHIMGLH